MLYSNAIWCLFALHFSPSFCFDKWVQYFYLCISCVSHAKIIICIAFLRDIYFKICRRACRKDSRL